MKKQKALHRFLVLLISFSLLFQSLPEINSHSHSTGFSNFHEFKSNGTITCFFLGQGPIHMSYTCGKTFHL